MSTFAGANDVVRSFLGGFGGSHEQDLANYASGMTEDVTFHTGFRQLTGRDEVLSYIGGQVGAFGVARTRIEILNIANDGSVVLTERIDHLYAPDGAELCAIPVAGRFEVRDGKIAAWRDIYDTAFLARHLPGGKMPELPGGETPGT